VEVSHAHRESVNDLQMVLRLPCRQSSHVTIEANPFMFWMSVLDLLSFSQSRLEVDFQYIAASMLQLLGDVNAVVNEHVVALQNRFAVELDGGVGVESIESENMLGVTRCLLDFGQLDFVSPRFVPNPLAVELVEAEEGIFDPGEASVWPSIYHHQRSAILLMVQEVQMHIRRYSFHGKPFIRVGLLERPAGSEWLGLGGFRHRSVSSGRQGRGLVEHCFD
jgi:hypothetical protein